LDEWLWTGRITLAGLLAALIGLERQYHYKEAGLRTHFLVGMGSAMLMLVSKYAFLDVASHPAVTFDPARVAAQVVSGIGFIGAGTIIFRRNAIHGLTTAAGLWSTSAIGLAIGAGMYIVGVASTVLVLTGLVFLDRLASRLPLSQLQRITVSVPDEPGAIGRLGTVLGDLGVNIGHIKVDTVDGGRMAVLLYIRRPPAVEMKTVIETIDQLADIRFVNATGRGRWPWHRGVDQALD
jgi:putative Mg2+ transporter-C (MgtC) family protein